MKIALGRRALRNTRRVWISVSVSVANLRRRVHPRTVHEARQEPTEEYSWIIVLFRRPIPTAAKFGTASFPCPHRGRAGAPRPRPVEGVGEDTIVNPSGLVRRRLEAALRSPVSGVAQQAEDAIARGQRIDDLFNPWREQLFRAPSKLPEKAIDLLAENSFQTLNKLATRFEMAFATAHRVRDRLESTGLVEHASGATRNRTDRARAILDILEEPSRIGSGRKQSRGRCDPEP